MDPATNIKDIVCKLNNNCTKSGPSLYLSVSPVLSEFSWYGNSLETLTERFLDRVIAFSFPAGCVRVAARQKRRMKDLEKFFSISPLHWFYLSVESIAETGFQNAAREVLADLGFRCLEWMGAENTESQLGAFSFGNSEELALILFMEDRGARRHCDFLIPVMKSAPCFTAADCLCEAVSR